MSGRNTPPTLVMKFGGTSVGEAPAIRKAAEIVAAARRDWPRLVVVLSAMSGVTDLLINTAVQAGAGERETIRPAAERLRARHQDALEALIEAGELRTSVENSVDELVDEFEQLCQAVAVLGELTPRALDAVASIGERLSVRVFQGVLAEMGIPGEFVEATDLIVTDANFGAAHPDLEASARQIGQRLEPSLGAGRVAVVTGFIAATPEGVTTTLGRGGSDYSAAILGASLPADEVWIWTDVDGVMSADPRMVPQARSIARLSYREIAELAYFGAKVVHPKTIRPVIEAGLGLRVRNTFNPEHPGTWLAADRPDQDHGTPKAVTAIAGQRLVTVEGRGMLGVPGVAARTFSAVAATGTSVPLITQASSEQSICFAVPAESAGGVIASLQAAFASELAQRDIDRIWATDEVVIVTVVGAGMRNTPGIAGKIFSALGACGANVIAIAQGSSEVSISLVVDAPDAGLAVGAIHELILNG